MINIILFIIELAIVLILINYMYKKDKIDGLINYSVVTIILINIISLKKGEILESNINLGVLLTASLFIVSNIIIQKKGTKEINKYILILIVTSIISYEILYMMSKATIKDSSLSSIYYNNLTTGNFRIFFSNIVTLIYCMFFNSKLYYYLKKEINKIWISNIITSIIIQLLYSILFIILATAITSPTYEIAHNIVIRSIISILICIVGTYVIYNCNKIKEK